MRGKKKKNAFWCKTFSISSTAGWYLCKPQKSLEKKITTDIRTEHLSIIYIYIY